MLVVGCSFEHGSLSNDPSGDDTSGGVDSGAGATITVDAASVACERTCPPGSTCANGHCQPPAGATPCSKASDCSGGMVCDLYVSGSSLVGYCTTAFPSAGTSCSTPGYDSACVTGICARDDDDHERCLVPCENGDDSTCPGDWTCRLVGAPLQIEGVPTSGQYACLGSD